MNRPGGVTLLAIAAMLVRAAIVAAADPPAPRKPAIVQRATVELVLIELYATDGDGRPIRDLTPDDLILTVDSHRKPVYSFELRDAGAEASVPGGSPAVEAGAGGTPRRYPRRFILFFEDDTSSPQGLTAARRAALRFVREGLLPDDEVAFASYDRRLHLLHDFTTDREALARTIDATLGGPKRFSDYLSDQLSMERDITEQLSMSAAGFARQSGQARLRSLILNYASQSTPRSQDVLRALKTLVDSLSHYPGYKGIVFMGDGIAENPSVDFLQRFGERIPPELISDLRRYDLSVEIRSIAQEASSAGVTLHSLQTSGLSNSTNSEMRDAGRRSNALETLALNTGGTKSSSNDLFKALGEAEKSSRSYYLVGYAPEGPPDGKYHSVQIRLKHRSGTLRWRRGFTRLQPDQARERSIEAAYVLPELYADLGVQLSGIPGPFEETGRVYDLVMHLPPGRVVFVPQAEGSTAELEAGFVLIDDEKRETARAAREARITIPNDRSPTTLGVNLYSRIHGPRGGQTVTAVVFDKAAGTVGAARLAIPPSAVPVSERALGLSIYSLREKSLWVEIPVSKSPAGSNETATDYQVGPALKSTFSVDEPLACGFRLGGGRVAGSVRCLIRDGDREVRATEWAAPGPPSGSGPDAFNVKLPVQGLPAGDYQLVVQVKDAEGSEFEAGATPLLLRATDGMPSPGTDTGS